MEKGSDLIPSRHNTMCKLFVIGEELVFSMVTVHKSSFLDLKNVKKAIHHSVMNYERIT